MCHFIIILNAIIGDLMNKFIFIGGIYPEFKMDEIKNKYGSLPQDAADNFQKSIISGLEDNILSAVTVFNTYFLPSSFFSFDKIAYYEWDGKYGKNYNLPYLRNRFLRFYSKTKSLINYISEYIDNNCKNETLNVIVYPAYIPFLKTIYELKKNYKLNVCLIVPDLPEYMGLTSHRSFYNRFVEKHISNVFRKYLCYIDSFVFLTESMRSYLGFPEKPFRIIEGVAPNNYIYNPPDNKTINRFVVYSGRLQMRYGIDVYLKAISLIDDYSLHFDFYGTGEGVEIIKKFSQKDSRVRYMGYYLPDELHVIQQNSLLLINPRQNEQEFTKFSFPSKTMEYMMSGRPVIAYKLDGMPDEYMDYILSPKDNSPEELAKTISYYSSLPDSELKEIGLNGRKFVVDNKNARVQAQKILELFNL